ncbi:MAG: proton-conducting transporter membrane subunit, partial [Oscillospiraceae bacterium]
NRFYSFFSVSLSGTLGVFLGSDLLTVFIFFEIMSFAVYVLVVHNQDQEAIKAGNSYLTITVLGGLVSLLGIFLLNGLTHTLVLEELSSACAPFWGNPMLYVAGFMIFFGFAAKAGLFPLHGWLAKTYTAAPSPATIALSSILSKVGVYGMIIVCLKVMQSSYIWALFVLALSVCTMLVGGISALLSVNLKETLAYSSMSQIGFITVGISMCALLNEEGSVAAYGTVLHMINHTLVKAILFICAGIIYKHTLTLDLNKLRGYGKDKPFLKLSFAIGSLGVMGVPGFNGYISKTLLHESITEKIQMTLGGIDVFNMAEVLFLISGGLTVAYMLKLFICLFVESPQENIERSKFHISIATKAILALSSLSVVIFGLFPHQTLERIAIFASDFMGVSRIENAVNYFSFTNLKGAFISIVIGLLLYFVIAKGTIITKQKGYINPKNSEWTIENLIFRPILFDFLPFVGGFFSRVLDVMTDSIVFVINRLFCKSVAVPITFFEGKEDTAQKKAERSSQISITRSLSYSLLLFGLGFLVTMLYLLISEFRV